MKLLVLAPFIDPEAVGEPRWCYDLAKGLTSRFDCTIVGLSPQHSRHKLAELFPEAQVHETPGWNLDRMPTRMRQVMKPHYLQFYRFARHVLARRIDKQAFSCAHQFGPLGMRYPVPLHDQGVPYAVGPLGGSLPLPPGFAARTTRDPWFYRFRDIDGMRFRHDPLLRKGYAQAACLIGVADYVRDVLTAVPLRRFATHPEVAAREPAAGADAAVAAKAARGGPVRMLIACRMIFSKGVHYALRALAQERANLPDWNLDVLGDGPYRSELEALARDSGIGDRVTFHGHIPRARVDDFYREADLFLFPSVREPSGAVIFEAMSWGLPIVAADYGGPGSHVRDAFGIRAPVASVEGYVAALAAGIAKLANDPALREEKARAALKAAREDYSMTAMVDHLATIYAEIGRR